MNRQREAARLILNSTFSNRMIAMIVGLSHTTIAKYRETLKHDGREWSVISELRDDEIESLFQKKRSFSSSKTEPDWAHIHGEMQYPNMTLQLLWEDYCLANPETAYGFSSFAYKYAKFKRKLDLSMRQSHRAGQMLFVDFAGSTIPYTDVASGEKRQSQIFVGAMGCSNYTFACAVKTQSIPDWIDAHNQMFLYLGGVPEVLVPDNLKSAVIHAGSSPTLNRTYLEMCKHYGVVIIPTRVRKPKDKAKAEVAVQIVSRWIIARLRHREFFSLNEINGAIAELLWQLNERPFKKLPGCRRSRFEELDKPMLQPHPGKPFEYAEWVSKQKVGLDYHVYVKEHYYSVPHELVGEPVEARVTKNIVEILNRGRRVASHPRSEIVGGHTTLPAHQPENHRHYAELTPDKFLVWAKNIGPATTAAIQNQFNKRPHALIGIKACSSLQRLAKEHGVERFEAACRRAESIGSLTVKSIRSILQRGLIDNVDDQFPVQINLPLHHHNVRGADYYAN